MLHQAVADLASSIPDQAPLSENFLFDYAVAGGVYRGIPEAGLASFSATWENPQGSGNLLNSIVVAHLDGWAIRLNEVAKLDDLEVSFGEHCRSELPYSPFPLNQEETEITIRKEDLSPLQSLAYTEGTWQKFIAERLVFYRAQWESDLLDRETLNASSERPLPRL